MNCEQVQSLLAAYLDGEVTPSERALMQAHLSGCTVCQQELDLLSTARSQVRAALQHRALQSAPSTEAWSRLEARLTEVAQPSSTFAAWFSRKAPSVSHASISKLFGGVSMRKKFLASAFGVLALLSIVAILLARSVTPVSAQEILDRAYQTQSQQLPSRGISHIRAEIFSNYKDQGMKTIVDSYTDLQTGYFRVVVTDSKTGEVLKVSAYDGTSTYSQDSQTVYRTPQGHVDLKEGGRKDGLDEQVMFEKMRHDPALLSVSKETWDDGRSVYVLKSRQPVKAVVNGQTEMPTGLVTMYFDTNTYKQIGYRMTMEKDGQEVLLGSEKTLVDEVLPADTNIAWDLSDVQGITIVDDPDRQHGDLLPEIISEPDLAAKTKNAYLLKSIPTGYTLEISAPPKQPVNEPFVYMATYQAKDNNYFVIGPTKGQKPHTDITENYTTVSGLVLHFVKDNNEPADKQFTSAFVDAPGGVVFLINSTLPQEIVKAWAEDLVLIGQ